MSAIELVAEVRMGNWQLDPYHTQVGFSASTWG